MAEVQQQFPVALPPQLTTDADVMSSDNDCSSSTQSDAAGGGGGGYTKLPPQVSMPPELAAKLDRQASCDSMEEGIQADSAPDSGEEGHNDKEESTEDEGVEPRGERSISVVSDGSEEGGRDSGIEAEREPDMVVPEEDLMSKVVSQVEFYFSDANVSKDKFLLKHIRRNKEGYVSLKLVSSFKKVKQLTRDWRVVAHSLNKSSTKIQINDLGTKIRRTEPLPEISDVPATCAVLVMGLPDPKPTIQSVSDLFSSCGEIAFIRVLRAGSAVPQDLKSLAAKHPSLGVSDCAWVEFETQDAARAATEVTHDGDLQVVPILPESQKKQEKAAQQQKQQQPGSRKNSVTGFPPQQKGPPSRKNSVTGGRGRKDSNCGLEGPMQQQPRFPPRRKCLSLPQTQSPNLKDLSAVVEARRNRPKSKSCTEFQLGGSPPSSHWVQRHLLAAAAASAASAASPVVGSKPPSRPNRISHGSLPLPDGVVRFPKGPDGGRGFGGARRRTSSIQDAVTILPTIADTTPTTTTTTTSSPTTTTLARNNSRDSGNDSGMDKGSDSS